MRMTMNLSEFIRFYSDFDVFPKLIPKSKLLRIYGGLLEIINEENSKMSIFFIKIIY